MPTILSHPAVPLALGVGLGQRLISPRLLIAGVIASIAPDFDTVGFKLGIDYAHDLGHRGISHSIVFALILGLIAYAFAHRLHTTKNRAFVFISAATLSHGLLDMCTTGGLGVALFWPFSHERWFFPLQVIKVSPIGISRFLTERGLAVLLSEALWVWLPCIVIALVLWGQRRVAR